MDKRVRDITKIAREVSKFTVRTMKAQGIGTAEFDFLHVVRKNPGITQAGIREILSLDKGACARRTASLEAKGYIVRKPNPKDRRSACLYATPDADRLKMSKASIEGRYYEWLLSGLSKKERQTFLTLLHKVYQRNKEESKAGFVHVEKALKESCDENGKEK
jgi:DNA-binding MarR family transcriptional regulator